MRLALVLAAAAIVSCDDSGPTPGPQLRDASAADARAPQPRDADTDAEPGADARVANINEFPDDIDVENAVNVLAVEGRLSLHPDFPATNDPTRLPITCFDAILWDASRLAHDVEACIYSEPDRRVSVVVTGDERELQRPRRNTATFTLAFGATFEATTGNVIALGSDRDADGQQTHYVPWARGPMRVGLDLGDSTRYGGTGIAGVYGDDTTRSSSLDYESRVIPGRAWVTTLD
ncbi:MAG: hypothetical protein EKK55_19285 [Rhodocyclaceae bacterium]|nr:MAG: hypothetical protein EKK55_19285 [Rhodocyclaceae bacterium]